MAKKEFTINTARIYDTIATATEQAPETQEPQETELETRQQTGYNAQENKKEHAARREYTDEEARPYLETMTNSGRKGVKMKRINLAFTPSNYEFIKIMARVRGQNLTEFVNDILTRTREENADVYARAIEFRNSL